MANEALGNFLIQLAVDDELRSRFNADKRATMTAAGLPEDIQEAVLQRDEELLEEKLELGQQHCQVSMTRKTTTRAKTTKKSAKKGTRKGTRKAAKKTKPKKKARR